ncbi:hypothetical protein [Acinetobacter sp. HY1485]|uniref:hypothetical protein n=1 Tax=Acinetobacter sp. HY1485 TaxID=2970918 RepID=UPI0022B9AAF0|nr:hypothetical protein [Acinetobacter sp. HY1485]
MEKVAKELLQEAAHELTTLHNLTVSDTGGKETWISDTQLLVNKIDEFLKHSSFKGNCSAERPCTPCYTDQSICEEKLQAFLTEMTEVSYKHGLKFVHPLNADTLAVTELHEDDLRGGGIGYQEVIKGSGFVEF